MNFLPPLEKANLPSPPKLRQLIGPSFIVLGLGLGSGELILWPYLTSNFGLGIIWGAVLGITFQFFMNMEIERYALVNGESIFVGFARKARWLPLWFLASTFFPWIWPGIIGSAAAIGGSVIGLDANHSHYLAIALLIIIGLILSLGPVLYKIQEKLQMWFIILGAPAIFILAILFATPTDWGALAQGVIGRGDGYLFLPAGIPLASFLAALAYSGAGGNLNLAQSYYIREKGYGMGKFMGRITSLLTGKKETLKVSGVTFNPEGNDLSDFKKWWRLINLEHLFVFLIAGMATILLLGLLAFSTTYGLAGTEQGINFVILEAQIIGLRFFPFLGKIFLIIVSLMLFATHLSVLDATSRILAENIILLASHKFKAENLRPLFYTVLWVQIFTGIIIFLFGIREPLTLLTISAVLNAVAMFAHLGLTLWLNTTSLHESLKPSLFRRLAMATAFIFFGAFSLVTFLNLR
ncbi:MAG: Nramp family divalent metal transporter [Candidatus Chisholmbacteria bacterium]|nr:Nramp family divalent metal transporter [Candidatus Chisholmbacteria bacterium]